MKISEQAVQEPSRMVNQVHGILEVGGSSLSTPFVPRLENCSFRYESNPADGIPIEQSPTFTCKSSFSSAISCDGTPSSLGGAFSFSSSFKSPSTSVSPTITSIPSFTFFSPESAVEQPSDLPGCTAIFSRDYAADDGMVIALVYISLLRTFGFSLVTRFLEFL